MRTNIKTQTLALIGLFLAASFVSLAPTSAPAEATAGGKEDEQALVSLEKGWANAYLTDDAAFLDDLLDSAFTLTNARGEVSTKDEEVAEVRDHALHYDKFESSGLKVRIYGDTAVVIGQTDIKANVKKTGRLIDGSVRFTDMFVRREGKWHAIASQATLLPKKS